MRSGCSANQGRENPDLLGKLCEWVGVWTGKGGWGNCCLRGVTASRKEVVVLAQVGITGHVRAWVICRDSRGGIHTFATNDDALFLETIFWEGGEQR